MRPIINYSNPELKDFLYGGPRLVRLKNQNINFMVSVVQKPKTKQIGVIAYKIGKIRPHADQHLFIDGENRDSWFKGLEIVKPLKLKSRNFQQHND